jgi:hypothetical protein
VLTKNTRCIELRIQSLSKEATKVPALEEEIESLSQFETELEEVKRKCERLVLWRL